MQDLINTDSNIRIKSNIILKSLTTSYGWTEYAPVDLLIELFPEYKDSRTDSFLSQQQRAQKKKTLYFVEKILDID
ncbi:MAG: hypothetical protein EOM05_09580 [Clostridia bacterium]|nr:hypothetical protein [Clostridia bacterium]